MWALRRSSIDTRITSPRNQRFFSPQMGVKTVENVGQLHETHKSEGGEITKDKLEIKPYLGEKRYDLLLYNLISETPIESMRIVLRKWLLDGNPIRRKEFCEVRASLWDHGQYAKALQFVEWLEGNMYLDFNEHDYASHLDLIAKMNGLNKAEHYIRRIPQSFRGEVIYRTLLANCATTTNVKRSTNVKKAEEVFKKMRDLGFPLSIYTCNHLLLLYKRFDPRKITDVVELMKKENVKPSLESYRHLIDSRGRANDISGMEAVMESMIAEGVKPDLLIQSSIAKYYIFGGLNEKAEQVLKDMGGDNIEDHGKACKFLLPLYAALHKADDVMRVWKLCESNPSKEECLAAIEAFGKLGRVESAEELFETTMKKCNKISSEYYNALLNVYANHKLLTKGEGLAKRMSYDGCTIGPVTWDALVKLYVSAGEVEKADSILAEADKKSMIKPWFNSYMAILSKYSVRGDIDNAEKIFERMRRNGHTVRRFSPYHLLLQAYIHAKAPAYGFRERLKADNLISNRTLSVQLAVVDPFKNTPASV